MRRPMRLLAFLLMPMFLLGMSLRTGATMAQVACGEGAPVERLNVLPAQVLDASSPILEDGYPTVTGPEAAEVVEEEIREVRGGSESQENGSWSYEACSAWSLHALMNTRSGLRGLPGQPCADSILPLLGLYRLFSVFRL